MPWRGVVVFVLGVIGLSYVELRLIVRLPNSTAAQYFALTSDLMPVLREEVHETSAKGPAAPEKRRLIPATSLTVPPH
jgi:hypothetical protein